MSGPRRPHRADVHKWLQLLKQSASLVFPRATLAEARG